LRQSFQKTMRDKLSQNRRRRIMIMRHLSLSVMALTLVLCGNAFAQQRLVRHNDQNDSCSRFKMRILIPADADHELPVKQFTGGVDSKMVWNPCAKETQIAIVPTIPPLKNDSLFPLTGTVNKQREPDVFVLAPPRFTLPRVWRRP
jgi:hypothetical protein